MEIRRTDSLVFRYELVEIDGPNASFPLRYSWGTTLTLRGARRAARRIIRRAERKARAPEVIEVIEA